ncbi:MAG: TonB-dependent receptor [Prevotellaceae bacterium]|jgi:hypothetical protein|nr:TonB-dependent receptor [Prevotellaceae bacterium]
MGGKRELPMQLSAEGGDSSYDYAQAYVRHLPDYFRLDVNISVKHNFKHCSVDWYFEAENLTNHKNIRIKYYNINRNREEFIYQYGFMPMGGVRIYFSTGK